MSYISTKFTYTASEHVESQQKQQGANPNPAASNKNKTSLLFVTTSLDLSSQNDVNLHGGKYTKNVYASEILGLTQISVTVLEGCHAGDKFGSILDRVES